MSIRACWANRGHQLIAQRFKAVLAHQALDLGGIDEAAGGLAIDPPLGDLPQTGSFEPTPEHLSYLNHADLPKSHRS